MNEASELNIDDTIKTGTKNNPKGEGETGRREIQGGQVR